MYRWRKMTVQQRAEILEERIAHQRPWHSPPHYESDSNCYMITAACFEHQPIIGVSPERMASYETGLLDAVENAGATTYAWTILPNHYHLLLHVKRVKALLKIIGQTHGRTSFEWNGEDDRRGRQVWCNATETVMKSERHFWASLVYVLNNAVKHGYVNRWQDWPYCNARQFIEEHGREYVLQLWREYPIDTYGADWDPPEL